MTIFGALQYELACNVRPVPFPCHSSLRPPGPSSLTVLSSENTALFSSTLPHKKLNALVERDQAFPQPRTGGNGGSISQRDNVGSNISPLPGCNDLPCGILNTRHHVLLVLSGYLVDDLFRFAIRENRVARVVVLENKSGHVSCVSGGGVALA
jgi:hypothetical protein